MSVTFRSVRFGELYMEKLGGWVHMSGFDIKLYYDTEGLVFQYSKLPFYALP